MTQVPTHKATRELGEAVTLGPNGWQFNWTSATLITAADTRSEGGCLRRVWYERVGGRERVETEAMRAGIGTHEEIEGYLHTGNRALSAAVTRALPYIDKPGEGLLIEQPILITARIPQPWHPPHVYLYCAGVPVAGHEDLINLRGTYIDAQGELRRDPTNTVEGKDWKSTSNVKYAKTADQVADTIQMNTYAMANFAMFPWAEHARTTHVYIQRNGRADAVLSTKLKTREQVETKWKYIEGVQRLLLDVIREPDAAKVPGNAKACQSYNSLCPHAGVCPTWNHNSLAELYGDTATKIANDFSKEIQMGIISNLPNPLPTMGQLPVMQGQQGQTVALPMVNQPAQDMRAQLEEEEKRLRAAQQQMQAQQAAQAPSPGIAMSLNDVWQRIQQHNMGAPQVSALAAQALAAASGVPLGVHGGLAGSGQLNAIVIRDPAEFYQLANELEQRAAQMTGADVPPTIVPPQSFAAPQPAPMLSQPVAPPTTSVFDAPPATFATNATANGILPPNAPQSIPALAQEQPKPATTEAPAEQKRGRGRPKNKESDPAPLAASAPVSAGPQGAPTTPVNTGAGSLSSPTSMVADNFAAQLEVYINCRPLGATTSLSNYIDFVNGELSRRYCVDGNGQPTIQDVRSAPKDSPLGFGGWKGAVREIVLKCPPPDAIYQLDTYADELNEVVANAFQTLCIARNARYVRGR